MCRAPTLLSTWMTAVNPLAAYFKRQPNPCRPCAPRQPTRICSLAAILGCAHRQVNAPRSCGSAVKSCQDHFSSAQSGLPGGKPQPCQATPHLPESLKQNFQTRFAGKKPRTELRPLPRAFHQSTITIRLAEERAGDGAAKSDGSHSICRTLTRGCPPPTKVLQPQP